MNRKKRLELNRICVGFIGFKNVINWYIDAQGVLWVETKHNLYSAKKVFRYLWIYNKTCLIFVK